MTATMSTPWPWARWLVGAEIAVAVAILGVGVPVAATLDSGHATFHVLFSLVGLVPALGIAIRSPRGGSTSTPPLIGLVLLAGAQLFEGIGAFGYGAGGNGRVNDIVVFHDIGVMLAPLGLIAGALGVAIGIGVLIARRSKRPSLALVISTVLLLGAGFVIAKMIGI